MTNDIKWSDRAKVLAGAEADRLATLAEALRVAAHNLPEFEGVVRTVNGKVQLRCVCNKYGTTFVPEFVIEQPENVFCKKCNAGIELDKTTDVQAYLRELLRDKYKTKTLVETAPYIYMPMGKARISVQKIKEGLSFLVDNAHASGYILPLTKVSFRAGENVLALSDAEYNELMIILKEDWTVLLDTRR